MLSQYVLLNGIGDVQNGPLVYISYLNPAPSLTIDPVNGSNTLGDYSGDQAVTLTGESDAIGKTVEIDIGAATSAPDPTQEYGNVPEAGTAVVQPDGTWSFTFDPASETKGPDGLFIEASVTGADGTPTRASLTPTLITTPPVVTAVSANSRDGAQRIGAGDTVTIYLTVNKALTVTGVPVLDLSNGATADYSGSFTVGGFPFTMIHYIEFTYTPALGDAGGPLSIIGLDTSKGSIVDGANDPLTGPFNQSLGLTVQTAPLLLGDFAASSSGSFLNSGAVTVYGNANIDQPGEYVTILDGSTVVGSEALAYSGSPSSSFFDVNTTTLAEGQHSLTAITSVGPLSTAATQSAASAALAFEVDTTPPARR